MNAATLFSQTLPRLLGWDLISSWSNTGRSEPSSLLGGHARGSAYPRIDPYCKDHEIWIIKEGYLIYRSEAPALGGFVHGKAWRARLRICLPADLKVTQPFWIWFVPVPRGFFLRYSPWIRCISSTKCPFSTNPHAKWACALPAPFLKLFYQSFYWFYSRSQ